MAKSTSGKWVSRVGSAGGGKTYQKTRPGNYYGVLAVIVILGLAVTVYSRYEYQNPVKSHSVAPVVGSTRYAALSIQSCGKTLPYLMADPTYKGGFIVQSDNVVKLSPISSADSGNNATLKQFVAEYPGLTATSTELAVPKGAGLANPATTYKNGQTCPTGTKYAGQKGKVIYAYWTSFAQKTPTLTTNPATIKFVKDLRVTMAFEPTGVTPSAPTQTTVDQMVLAATTSSTTTTAPTATTTTAPSATTTTAPSATTTTAPTATTTTTKG